MTRPFLKYYDDYVAWMHKSLVLWADIGRDVHGGWYEHLDKSGAADIKAIRRHRIQARQVYSYATAQMNGWYEGRDIAVKTFEFMCLQGWQGEHFIHRLDQDYKITDERCDLYDHAFSLLGTAALYKLTGKPLYRLWIDKIITAIDRLRSENGGWKEDNLGTTPRRQNPHMHLFEAHLYLYDATKDTRFLRRAQESLSLFKAHFYNQDVQGIHEFFNVDWTLSSGQKGRTLEPGHAAEWIWLLGLYDRLTGDDHSHIREMIFDHLSRQAGPYLIDESCIDESKPSAHKAVRTTRRLWVQTEWIKAHITLIRDGYSPAAAMLPDLFEHFMEDYLTPSGLWQDQCDAKGHDIAATIPVSSMYHIIAMVNELKPLAEQ